MKEKELNIFDQFDRLPRRLDVVGNGNKNGRYRLIVIDNETQGNPYCCILRYSKEIKNGFSKKFLFEAFGRTLEDAIHNMYEKYLEIRPNYIQGIVFLDKEYQSDLKQKP